MANPRQRRKSRSSINKVRLSKRANSKLKKVVPKNIPEPLLGSYDRKKTPHQNFKALGILSGKLDPRLSGGIEKDVSLKRAWLNQRKNLDEFEVFKLDRQNNRDDINLNSEESEDDEDEDDSDRSSNDDDDEGTKLSKGEGRIIRDKDGKILKVIIGEEEGEIELNPDREGGSRDKDSSSLIIKRATSNLSDKDSTPWGKPLEDFDYEKDSVKSSIPTTLDQPSNSSGNGNCQGISYHNPRRGIVEPKTSFVKELEKISNKRSKRYSESIKSKRHLSSNQIEWIESIISSKYLNPKKGRNLNNNQEEKEKEEEDRDREGRIERIESLIEGDDEDGGKLDMIVKDLKLNPLQRTKGEIKNFIRKFLDQQM